MAKTIKKYSAYNPNEIMKECEDFLISIPGGDMLLNRLKEGKPVRQNYGVANEDINAMTPFERLVYAVAWRAAEDWRRASKGANFTV